MLPTAIRKEGLPLAAQPSTNAISFQAAWTKRMEAGVPSVLFSEELTSVGWRFAGVFVFEISVHIHALAKPGVEASSPGRDLLRGVVFKAQAGIGEVGSKHVGRCLLVGLGQ